MAKISKMIFDKTEITCFYKDRENKLFRKMKKVSIDKKNILALSIKPCREKKNLKVMPSERIIIRTTKLPKPIEYYKFKEGEFFEEYKSGLRLFCRQNMIKLIDEAG